MKAGEWISWQGLETWTYRQPVEENPEDGYNVQQPDSSRARSARNDENIEKVEDRVLSQDKPKMDQSTYKVSHETGIPHSSVHIRRDLQLKCFKRLRAQLLSEASRIARLARLADKQPYLLQ